MKKIIRRTLIPVSFAGIVFAFLQIVTIIIPTPLAPMLGGGLTLWCMTLAIAGVTLTVTDIATEEHDQCDDCRAQR